MGAFDFNGWNNNFILLQLFLFVSIVTILFFKAILTKKKAEENKLKISEHVLRTERNILKATIESTNTTSIFSLDTNLNYLNFNSPHEKFMKNIHGASIKIGDNHLDLISYKNQKTHLFSIFQNVLNGNSYEKEEKDIENNYWKISKFPIRDNDENIIGISVIIIDISYLKQKEIELKENNLSLNERIKELRCLYTVTKIINQKSLSKSEKLQSCAQIIPAAFQFPEKTNCKIQFLEEEFLSDNYIKPNTHISQRIVIKGEECGCIEAGYFDDKKTDNEAIFLEEESKLLETLSEIISKSLQTGIAEENLKISEEKFRSIYENMQDVYYLHTLDGNILDVSPSVEKHFQEKKENLIGMQVPNFYKEPAKYEELKSKILKEGAINDQEIEFLTPLGKTLFFSVNSRLINDTNGFPTLVEGTMRNINERIVNQKEILSKNRKLEFQNAELEQFAYIASHDLQEPLITVIHCIQMLEEELGENLDEDQKQYLEFINSSTSRMQSLVKGLLDYSRIGKERKSNPIDCNEIVANVLEDMKASLTENNARVEYENLPIIESNTTEMRQLFQNLISNATKFRKKDQHPKIKIAALKQDNNWLFSVEDNGIGIEKHNMDKVFVIFKRLHNRDEYPGTGIGLSYCKKIIEQHKGKIWVESKFNEGSTFKWTLPIEQSL